MKHRINSDTNVIQKNDGKYKVTIPEVKVTGRLRELAKNFTDQGLRPGRIGSVRMRDKYLEHVDKEVDALQNILATQSFVAPEVLLLQRNIALLQARTQTFPLETKIFAAQALGLMDPTNAAKDINKAEKRGELFTVMFFNGTAKVPVFQIDKDSKKIYPIIKDLLNGLTDEHKNPVESWLVYDWFTTPIEEGGPCPAELLDEPEAYDELKYLAKLAGARMAGRMAV